MAGFVFRTGRIDRLARSRQSGSTSSMGWSTSAAARLVFLKFDDVGVSAYSHVADQLDRPGWVGHFFVSTGYTGQLSFSSRDQIRELVRRGHAVGSHSHTHPLRMANCFPEELRTEWQTSVDIIPRSLERA
jgi:peptidoglycan/xylan/chitin deacetylase (PgdA/CDA1 family)